MVKKGIIFSLVLAVSMLAGYRVRKIQKEGHLVVNNIVRIQTENGAPRDFVVAKKTADFLEEPMFVQNGRALVSASRVKDFAAGQRIKDTDAKITFVSDGIDLDSGMFVVRVSGRAKGQVWVLKPYTGYFLPIDAILPPHAKVIAKDNTRIVVSGLTDGEKVEVR
ncbi:MAG: hypothetical protein LBL46_04565 [Rickettsiales bacterium]|jgi:hypothetical protein|nr:hypothetical protein [Rickettsiales bacterium]